jgi:hypothetical protein
MRFIHILLCASALVFIPAVTRADSFQTIEAMPLDELWLNAGFYSYHFQKDINLDNNNIGAGVEYRYSTVHSITAGRFHNSDMQMSEYAAWYWQPFAWGPVHLGGLIGMIDGYPKAQNGAWFPLVLPVASVEYKRVGINLTVVPTYKETLYGSISVQLKLKVF